MVSRRSSDLVRDRSLLSSGTRHENSGSCKLSIMVDFFSKFFAFHKLLGEQVDVAIQGADKDRPNQVPQSWFNGTEANGYPVGIIPANFTRIFLPGLIGITYPFVTNLCYSDTVVQQSI